MKRILLLFGLLLVSVLGMAQAPSNYTNINGRYRWIAGMFDSTFSLPKGTTPSLRTGGSTNPGAIFYNTTDSSVYTYTGTQWIKLRGVVIDTTSLSNRINLKLNISDTSSMLTDYFRINGVGLNRAGQTVLADTLLLSTRAWRQKGIDSVASLITSGYVPYTGATTNVDLGTHTLTAKNLVINHASGSGVAASITKGGNGEALTISKTSGSGNAMSVSGGLTSLVDLSLSSISNATTDTDRFLVSDGGVVKYRTGAELLSDIGGASASGYVPYTGATTNVNLGSYSLTADALLSEKYLMVKQTNSGYSASGYTTLTTNSVTPRFTFNYGDGVRFANFNFAGGDYYYTLPSATGTLALTSDITGAVSGTTNYIPKFTGANSLGNSVIYESSSNIGIGTITPAKKLDVVGTAQVSGEMTFGNDVVLTNSAYIYSNAGGSGVRAGMFFDGTGTNLRSFIGGSEQMRLTSTGLGIGTSSPAYKLNVVSSNSTISRFDGSSIVASSAGEIDILGPQSNGEINLGVGGSTITDASNNIQNKAYITASSGLAGLNLRSDAGYVQITAGGVASSNEVARFTASGNVGIGTSSPTEKLQVGGSSGAVATPTAIRMDDTYRAGADAFDALKFYLFKGASETYGFGLGNIADVQYWAGSSSTGAHRFFTSRTERMRLDASGNLGIGVTSMSYKLQVAGVINTTATSGYLLRDGDVAGYGIFKGSTTRIGIAANGNEYLSVTSGGNVGIGTVSPGEKLEIYGSAAATSNFTALKLTNGSDGGLKILFSNAVSSELASIIAGVSSAGGGTDDGTLIFSTATNAVSNERMRITSGGNVGIGTTSPNTILNLYSSLPILRWQNPTSGTGVSDGGDIYLQDNDFWVRNIESGILGFATSGAERMRITSGGNVGIGTTAPSEKLEVNGNIKTAAPTGGTAKPWKLGERVATGVTFDSGQYIRVEIDGVTYYLATVSID